MTAKEWTEQNDMMKYPQAYVTNEKKPVDLYTRFQTEKVIIEIHDSDYGIVGHITHSNETYIIFDPAEEHRHPMIIPWTSIYTIRLVEKEMKNNG